MEYCKFIQDKNNLYQYGGSSSIAMDILGDFLSSNYNGDKFFY
jgi:hypothetical protein